MLKQLLLGAAGLAFVVGALAKEPVFATGDGAIRGYDPVAYFRNNAPTKGDARHTLEWNGATWRFSSAENLAAFKSDPERFAPRYGGYCAWAVANGYTASIDPTAWAVVDGRLYLNYSKGVQRRWQADVAGNIAKADSHWPGVLEN